MATASLNELIQSYIMRRNQINLDLTNYSSQKTLATGETSELAGWKNSRYNSLITQYKQVYSETYKDNSSYTYVDYTQLQEYKDEVSYVDSYYDAKTEDLTNWETQLDNQITTVNTELSEITSYIDSFKQMLSSNIKVDYNYGTK